MRAGRARADPPIRGVRYDVGMDAVPPPVDTQPSRHELQMAGRRRQRRRRMRRAVTTCVVLALIAAAGYGVYFWLDGGFSGQERVATAGTTDTGLPSGDSRVGAGDTLGDDATSGSLEATATSASTEPPPTTSSTHENLAPQTLTLTCNPEIANVTITLQDGQTVKGKTPFEQEIPGGAIRIQLQKKGYNLAEHEVLLDQKTTLKFWLDPEGLLYQSLVRFKCGPNPKQVAFTPDGSEMWVSLLGGYGLQIFEPTTGRKLDGVDLGDYGAVEVIFSRDGTKAYASQMETASVFEIDRATCQVKRTFKTGGDWTKVLLLSPDEKTLWASNWISNDVSEIDLTTGKLVRRMKTVVTPRGLYVTPDGKRLFVAGFENGDIQRIDLATGKGEVLFKTGGAMRHMVGDDQRGLLYVDDMSTKEVFVVDLATEKVTKLADTNERPNTMDLSPDGKVLYVSNRGKDNPKTYYIPGPEWGSVLAIDTATGKILDAIVGGNQCTGLDVSPDGRLLAFSDFLDNKIRVYTIPDYDTLAAGGGGRAEAHLADLAKD